MAMVITLMTALDMLPIGAIRVNILTLLSRRASLASFILEVRYSSALYARMTLDPVRFSRTSRLTSSFSHWMRLKYFITDHMTIAMVAAMIRTPTIVISVHSQVDPDIFSTAQVASIGDLTMTCRLLPRKFCSW